MMTSFFPLNAKGKKLERIIGTYPLASRLFFRFYSVVAFPTTTRYAAHLGIAHRIL